MTQLPNQVVPGSCLGASLTIAAAEQQQQLPFYAELKAMTINTALSFW